MDTTTKNSQQITMIIQRFCPAKINLFLHLVKQRADGYHDLQTAFILLDWGDTLQVEMTGPAPTRMNAHLQHIQLQAIDGVSRESNLIFKALQAYAQHIQRPIPALNITISKSIPMGAGLGGGSSNAASMLLVLNQLMGFPLSIDELSHIGASLGADVPVFVRQSHAWAEGIGDQLRPIQSEKMYFLLALPEVLVNTVQAFQAEDLVRSHPPLQPLHTLRLQGPSHNHFEPVIRRRFAAIDECFLQLSAYGQPRLSGTGACVFLAFTSKTQAQKTQALLQQQRPTLRVVLATSYP